MGVEKGLGVLKGIEDLLKLEYQSEVGRQKVKRSGMF